MERQQLAELGVHFDGPSNAIIFNYLNSQLSVIESPIQLRPGRFDIGFIGANTYIGGGSGTVLRNINRIGRYCSIAGNVVSGSVEHPTNFLSTHPLFYGQWKHSWPEKASFYEQFDPQVEKCKEQYELFSENKFKKGINIGSDVWIGEGVFISSGVTIGDGAIVAARSVVTKDVEPYAIVAGSPARTIRFRFSREIVQRLLKIKWWLYDDNIFKGVDFSCIETAICSMEENISSGRALLYSPSAVEVNSNFNSIESNEEGINFSELFYKDSREKIHECFNLKTGFCFKLNVLNSADKEYANYFKFGIENALAYVANLTVKSGDFVLDIGAKVGFSSHVFFNKGAKNVYAYEPLPGLFKDLVVNGSSNYRFKAFNFSLSSENGKREMTLSSVNEGHVLCDTPVTVTERTLDSIMFPREIDLIKIDAQGEAFATLQGATALMSSDKRPRVVLIKSNERSLDSVYIYLKESYEYVYRLMKDHDKAFYLERMSDLEYSNSTPPIYVFSREEIA